MQNDEQKPDLHIVVAQLLNKVRSLVERLDDLEKTAVKIKMLETSNGD